jgi:general secretion pathway protein K
VITSVAVVTALTVDLAYNTRVSVQMAANARDELQAYYLARSGVNLSRLVLHFQQRFEKGAAGSVGRALGGTGASISVRLWEMVPVASTTLGFLSGAPGREGRAGFGEFPGGFVAKVEDEDRKVNLRQFDGLAVFQVVQAARLNELLKDQRWDFLFDREDANGLKVTRPELFAALKDWIDIDETGSHYTGGVPPFESAFGDENAIYDRLPDRYKAKNAPFDSLDELYLVAGVSDAFMAAFGERLTIWPDVNATINVNTDDPRELFLNAVAMGGGILQPAMLDPAFIEKLQAALRLARPLPFLALTATQFAQVLQALGVQVAPQLLEKANKGVSNAFGDTSTTFRIRATGQAGGVEKSVEAVVIFDRRALGLDQDLGRLIHWSEE